ncbi:hypothetical protein [Halomonas sp. B23F22_10]|uniref:hypothetical protein n=1 Tax=Halomonas sp. B23F22_10 TaxID=3459515 RepID=UPI00373F83A1
MSKPNWIQAPEWADSLVQREDGRWVFFEGEAFVFDGIPGGEWVSETNRHEPMGFSEPPPNDGWRKTLERRP